MLRLFPAMVSTGALFLTGCASVDGPSIALNRFGPVVPASPAVTGGAQSITLFTKFTAAFTASAAAISGSEHEGDLAKALLNSGADVIKSNCNDYFDDSGRTERRLLIAKDMTTFAGALGEAIAGASRGSKGTILGIALGTTSLQAGNDLLRSELSFGAAYTSSVHVLVNNALQTMLDKQVSKDSAHYTFGAAIGDLRDLQDVCLPAQIVENVKAAISNAQFKAVDATTISTSLSPAPAGQPAAAPGAAAPSPADKAKAGAAKQALTAMKGALPGDVRLEALLSDMVKLEDGQAVIPVTAPVVEAPSQPLQANHRVRLVPSS
jgi:hypothetical protein